MEGGTGWGTFCPGFIFMKDLKFKFNHVRFSPDEGSGTETEIHGALNKVHHKTSLVFQYKTILSV